MEIQFVQAAQVIVDLVEVPNHQLDQLELAKRLLDLHQLTALLLNKVLHLHQVVVADQKVLAVEAVVAAVAVGQQEVVVDNLN